ncbi:hypothetical protein H5410_024486 [Solanum commersonii]|uniref:Uncharacterized protein n=1 Tax=Solanum commersonii TaxID=4109 RepID=A0A9J5ZM31_SOLCO|nr:hypothetical protein H5410_024486 [Solanum commersonii]
MQYLFNLWKIQRIICLVENPIYSSRESSEGFVRGFLKFVLLHLTLASVLHAFEITRPSR